MARNRRNKSLSDDEFWRSAFSKSTLYTMFYNRIVDLCLSRFEYKNLPDTIDPRFIELALLGDGMAVYFNDEVVGNLCLRVMAQGPIGLYDIPERRTAYANNGYRKELTEEDSVMVYNNYTRTPSTMHIANYANRLAELEMTISVNIKAQKTPLLITANERERYSMLNTYMKYSGDQPVIFGTKSFDPNSFNVLKTDAPYVSDKLYQLKTDTWNEMLTWLGISNVSITKKERLITDEVNRSQGGTIASRLSGLEARRDAIEKINRMFNQNIEVIMREELDTTLPTEPYLEDTGSEKDGDSDE